MNYKPIDHKKRIREYGMQIYADDYLGGGIVSPTPFSPSDIAGLNLWLKADSLVLNDNDPITTWADQSGNGNDATQVGAVGIKPIYKTNIINGKPIVRFDGIDDYLDLPNFAAGFTSGEIFIVVRLDADPPAVGSATGLWLFGTTAVNEATHFPFTDGIVYDRWGSTARKTTGNPALSLATNFRLYNVVSQANEWTSRIDGAQHFTTAVNTTAFNATLFLGRSFDTVNSFYVDGDIAEVIMYNAILSAQDRQSIQTYVTTKYGLVF